MEKRSKVYGRLIILCLVLLVALNVSGQETPTVTGWDLRSLDQDISIYDIHTLDRQSVLIGGSNGEVLSTTDNGTNWQSIDIGTSETIRAIDRLGNITVYGGDNGLLLLNTSSSIEDISPTTSTIRDVDVVAVNETNITIYIAGDGGEIWKTDDSGNTWNEMTSTTSSNINGISFLNASYGLAVGDDGLLLGTSDGQSWEARDLPSGFVDVDLNAIEFYNEFRAFAVGDSGTFLRSDTSDTPITGYVWQSWETDSDADLLDLDVTSSNKVFTAGSNGTVLLTKDGGNIFNQQKIPVVGIDLHAISMADRFYGYIVGDEGNVLFTDREGIAEDERPSVRDFSDFSVYWEQAGPIIVDGFINMLRIIFISMLAGFVLGVTFAVGNTVEIRPINFISTIYTDFFRNTPLLVQLFIIHFGFPEVGIDLTLNGLLGARSFASAIVGLSLNSGAYQAEIIRSGIQAIPTGQMEAGRSVGLSYGQTMRYIILPQAIRVVIPPLGNEFVNLTLNSSLASAIGFTELTRAGRLIIAVSFLNFQTWTIIALFYFVITYSLTNLLRYAEKKTKIPGLGMGRV